MKFVALFILTTTLTFSAFCQQFPADGARLHYSIIGFWVPETPQTNSYTVQVADGSYSDDNSFNSHIIKTFTSKTNQVTGRVPYWGKPYTWRVISTLHDKSVIKTALYHFSTITTPFIDTGVYRLHILKPAGKYSRAFVFCDKNRTMYDLQGSPVWYLPNMPGIVDDKSDIRDLKASRFGTITFATNNMAYEINYRGELLWQTPTPESLNGGIPGGYHHELSRLSNGHYMVLGNEYLPWEWSITQGGDSVLHLLSPDTSNGKANPKMCFGTVVELDSSGNVVWSWKSSDYFKQTGQVQRASVKKLFDTHENSFFFDERNKAVYISFKNLSQVVKVKYPDGNVTAVYGNLTDNIMPQNSLFCHQHGCKISKKGNLYLFNNNICHANQTPTAVVMEEPNSKHPEMKKMWEYMYPYKGDFTEQRKNGGTSGGNVAELPGGELLVSMCAPYGNVFIVNQQKQLLWDAVLQRKDQNEKTWKTESSYRCSIIPSQFNFEQLIWGKQTDIN